MGIEEAVARHCLVEADSGLDFGKKAGRTSDPSAVEECEGNHASERVCQIAAADVVDVAVAAAAAAAAAAARRRGMWWGGFLGHKEHLSTVIDGLPRDVSKGREGIAFPRTG